MFFAQKSTSKEHIASGHKGSKPFHCEICGAMFAHKSILKEHIASVNKVKKPFILKLVVQSLLKKSSKKNILLWSLYVPCCLCLIYRCKSSSQFNFRGSTSALLSFNTLTTKFKERVYCLVSKSERGKFLLVVLDIYITRLFYNFTLLCGLFKTTKKCKYLLQFLYF